MLAIPGGGIRLFGAGICRVLLMVRGEPFGPVILLQAVAADVAVKVLVIYCWAFAGCELPEHICDVGWWATDASVVI